MPFAGDFRMWEVLYMDLSAMPQPRHPSPSLPPSCEFVRFVAPGKDTNSQFGEGDVGRVDG